MHMDQEHSKEPSTTFVRTDPQHAARQAPSDPPLRVDDTSLAFPGASLHPLAHSGSSSSSSPFGGSPTQQGRRPMGVRGPGMTGMPAHRGGDRRGGVGSASSSNATPTPAASESGGSASFSHSTTTAELSGWTAVSAVLSQLQGSTTTLASEVVRSFSGDLPRGKVAGGTDMEAPNMEFYSQIAFHLLGSDGDDDDSDYAARDHTSSTLPEIGAAASTVVVTSSIIGINPLPVYPPRDPGTDKPVIPSSEVGGGGRSNGMGFLPLGPQQCSSLESSLAAEGSSCTSYLTHTGTGNQAGSPVHSTDYQSTAGLDQSPRYSSTTTHLSPVLMSFRSMIRSDGGESNVSPVFRNFVDGSGSPRLNLAPNISDSTHHQLRQQQQRTIGAVGSLPHTRPIGAVGSSVPLHPSTVTASSPLRISQDQPTSSTLSEAAASILFPSAGQRDSTFSGLRLTDASDRITLPQAAATYDGGEAVRQRVDQDGCFTVVDPQRRKLRVPSTAIQPTKAFNGRLATPSLCLLFQSGRCRQGANCYQVHADAEVIKALRLQAESLPCCCSVHGDCNDNMWDVKMYEGQMLSVVSTPLMMTPLPQPTSTLQPQPQPQSQQPMAMAGMLPQPSQSTIPMSRLAYTLGLQRTLQEGKLTVPASMLCRLHSQGGGCRFGADCKFLHVCRQLGLQKNHQDPLGPSVVSVPTRDTKIAPGIAPALLIAGSRIAAATVQPPPSLNSHLGSGVVPPCLSNSRSQFSSGCSPSGLSLSCSHPFANSNSSLPPQMMNMSGSFANNSFPGHLTNGAPPQNHMPRRSPHHHHSHTHQHHRQQSMFFVQNNNSMAHGPVNPSPSPPMAGSPFPGSQVHAPRVHHGDPAHCNPNSSAPFTFPPNDPSMMHSVNSVPSPMNAPPQNQHQQQHQHQQRQQYVLQRVNADGSLTLMPVNMLMQQQQQQGVFQHF